MGKANKKKQGKKSSFYLFVLGLILLVLIINRDINKSSGYVDDEYSTETTTRYSVLENFINGDDYNKNDDSTNNDKYIYGDEYTGQDTTSDGDNTNKTSLKSASIDLSMFSAFYDIYYKGYVKAPESFEIDTYYYNSLSSDEKKIYRELLSELAAGNDSVKFTLTNDFNIEEEINRAVYAVCYDYPEIFWINPGNAFSCYSDFRGNYTVDLSVYVYEFWENTLFKQLYIDKLYDATEKIVNKASIYSTDFDRVEFVHDYICENARYNTNAADGVRNNTYLQSAVLAQATSAYGCLVNGTPICGGYSKGFMLALRELGIECMFVTGYAGENHAWNIVEMDNEYYFMDITWDDPVYDNEKTYLRAYDEPDHKYFAVTEERMKTDHTVNMVLAYPDCTSTEHNYYIKKGYYLKKYSFDGAMRIINKQKNEYLVQIAFPNKTELFEAKQELIDRSRYRETFIGNKGIMYFADENTYVLSLFVG